MNKFIASAGLALLIVGGSVSAASATEPEVTPSPSESSQPTAPTADGADQTEPSGSTPTGTSEDTSTTPEETTTTPSPSTTPSTPTDPAPENEQPTNPDTPADDTGEIGDPVAVATATFFMPGSDGPFISWPQRALQPGDDGWCQTDDVYDVSTPDKQALFDSLLADGWLYEGEDSPIYISGGEALPCSLPPTTPETPENPDTPTTPENPATPSEPTEGPSAPVEEATAQTVVADEAPANLPTELASTGTTPQLVDTRMTLAYVAGSGLVAGIAVLLVLWGIRRYNRSEA